MKRLLALIAASFLFAAPMGCQLFSSPAQAAAADEDAGEPDASTMDVNDEPDGMPPQSPQH